MTWSLFILPDGERHVVPNADVTSHEFDQCWCSPFDTDGIKVHNSLDQREIRERLVAK